VVDVDTSLGGHHADLVSPVQVNSDIRMTLATYTHATKGMQDSPAAALEETFSRSGCRHAFVEGLWQHCQSSLFFCCLQEVQGVAGPGFDRGHHDFQLYPEPLRYAENPRR
jgi:hypothetical protein